MRKIFLLLYSILLPQITSANEDKCPVLEVENLSHIEFEKVIIVNNKKWYLTKIFSVFHDSIGTNEVYIPTSSDVKKIYKIVLDQEKIDYLCQYIAYTHEKKIYLQISKIGA